MAQLHALPHSHQRILDKAKHPLKKADKEAQLVSNFSTYTAPKVTKLIQTLGNILNPHEIYEISPVVYLGEGPWIKDLQTWRQPGAQISDMSAKALTSQKDKAKKLQSSKCSEI